jgi:hypothetical protein
MPTAGRLAVQSYSEKTAPSTQREQRISGAQWGGSFWYPKPSISSITPEVKLLLSAILLRLVFLFQILYRRLFFITGSRTDLPVATLALGQNQKFRAISTKAVLSDPVFRILLLLCRHLSGSLT